MDHKKGKQNNNIESNQEIIKVTFFFLFFKFYEWKWKGFFFHMIMVGTGKVGIELGKVTQDDVFFKTNLYSAID